MYSSIGRAFACRAKSYGFESHYSRLIESPVVELVDTVDLGSIFWGFESSSGYFTTIQGLPYIEILFIIFNYKSLIKIVNEIIKY